MDNPVVVRAAEVAEEEGVGTLRFNFRGVGASTGVHDRGEGEQADLRAALALLNLHLPAGRPLAILGYSFGAWIAALVAGSDSTIAALGLVAPPIATVEFAALPDRNLDILLAAGTRDTYCPASALQAMADRTPGAKAVIVDGADHFFFGKLFPLGEAIRVWARRFAR
jgi:alpha/beta superfamily hydrolase